MVTGYEHKVYISIHAPPRGATTADIDPDNNEVFQFTPLREGRPARRCNAGVHAHFNSRPSARGDSMQYNMSIRKIISIHAPPRGATGPLPRTVAGDDLFQFTPLREGRPPQARRQGRPDTFQFTPLREGRRTSPAHGCWRRFISIHAPPRGATTAPESSEQARTISIHAPPRGATPCRGRTRARGAYFNSRPSARGDRNTSAGCPADEYFNSRPSARGDHSAAVDIY